MADESRILSGAFKGVAFTVDSATLAGGRKVAVKQFPNRDTQSVEDLGMKPRVYGLEIVISDKPGQGYLEYRDALIAVLEEGGPGELIHPLYGRIEGIVAVSYSLNERFSEYGSATLSVQFELNNNPGIPTRSASVVTELQASNDSVRAAVTANISSSVKVTPSYVDSLTSAVSSIKAAIDKAGKAVSYKGAVAEGANGYYAVLKKFAASATALARESTALAASYDTMMSNANDLYNVALLRFRVFEGFFDFKGNGSPSKTDTASREERKQNAETLRDAVNALALGYAYLAAPSITFETVDDIDAVSLALDTQYRLVMQGASSQEVKDSLTDMRVKTLQALDDVRINTSRIITEYTLPTTARLLAFVYYGDDSLGETIANLNRIDDVSFVSGNVEILTQ